MVKTGHFSRWSALALILAICSTASLQAASVNYGNFGPVAPGVTFLNVVESSGTDGVPLYNSPSPFATGLNFTPTVFTSSSTGAGADITDGQLNFTIHGQDGNGNNVAISSINLSENGAYTLAGVGTAATQISVGAIMNVKITEIDGVAVAPITVIGNASLAKNLVSDAGVASPWALNVFIDVQNQLTTLGVPFVTGATRADVVLNNTLVSISQAGSAASVSKNNFQISIVPQSEVVPEPTTLAMAGLALCGVGLAGRRKRS
ncbi:PEP-CTERM sorting domain-containing protein [Lacipirellula sp.]|uniref:PEP-CTERM sorting domain-containing protein n=1 Tax=Lacipirellula sp. TaxID=2691419 RepID=UPI003D0A063C